MLVLPRTRCSHSILSLYAAPLATGHRHCGLRAYYALLCLRVVAATRLRRCGGHVDRMLVVVDFVAAVVAESVAVGLFLAARAAAHVRAVDNVYGGRRHTYPHCRTSSSSSSDSATIRCFVGQSEDSYLGQAAQDSAQPTRTQLSAHSEFVRECTVCCEFVAGQLVRVADDTTVAHQQHSRSLDALFECYISASERQQL